MRQRRMLAALVCCALLTGIGAPVRAQTTWNTMEQAVRPMTAAQVLETVNARHQEVKKPAVDLAAQLHTDYKKQFSSERYTADKSFKGQAPLTRQQAAEDVDVLFAGLRELYGPYYYFGGETAFDRAKAEILTECGQEQRLTADFLAESIRRHLAFVRDGHFQVNGQRLAQPHIARIFGEKAFYQTADGYRSQDGRVVASVDGHVDLNGLFHMSLSPAGNVVWYPVLLEETSEDLKASSLRVQYRDGSTETLTAGPWQSWYDESERMVELHYNQGIPVLFVRNMGFDEAQGDEIGQAFMRYAAQLKNAPVLILDLRSNGGGNSLLSLKWLQEYAGAFVPTNYLGLQYWSTEDMDTFCANTENQYYISRETMEQLGATKPVSAAYMGQMTQPDDFVANDRLLIVLTGKNTASAAETFTDAVRNLENTLVVGQNTFGVLVSNAYTAIVLPNSGTTVRLGSDLNFFPENDFEEFTGFQPDLWVAGDAEQAAASFAVRYLAEQAQR